MYSKDESRTDKIDAIFTKMAKTKSKVEVVKAIDGSIQRNEENISHLKRLRRQILGTDWRNRKGWIGDCWI